MQVRNKRCSGQRDVQMPCDDQTPNAYPQGHQFNWRAARAICSPAPCLIQLCQPEETMIKSLIKTGTAFAVALGIFSTASSAADLKVGIDASYPPFSVVAGDGTITGLEADFTQALCERIDMTCELVPMQFDAIIPALQSRKIDIIIGSLSITEERAKVIDFSDAYYQTALQLVGLSGQAGANLDGATLGVERGSVAAGYADENLGQASIKTYDSQLAAMEDLKAGRVDYVLGDQLTVYDWLQKDTEDKFAFVGEPIVDNKYAGAGIGVGLRKGSDDLKAAINAEIAAMHSDGSFDAITDDYFPFPIK